MTTKTNLTVENINALVAAKVAADEVARNAKDSARNAGDAMRDLLSKFNGEFEKRLLAKLGIKDFDELMPEFVLAKPTGRYASASHKNFKVRYVFSAPSLFNMSYGYDNHRFSLNENFYCYSEIQDSSGRRVSVPYGFDTSKLDAQFNHSDKVAKAAKAVAKKMIAEFNLTTVSTYS